MSVEKCFGRVVKSAICVLLYESICVLLYAHVSRQVFWKLCLVSSLYVALTIPSRMSVDKYCAKVFVILDDKFSLFGVFSGHKMRKVVFLCT